jgi:hypothetical protein
LDPWGGAGRRRPLLATFPDVVSLHTFSFSLKIGSPLWRKGPSLTENVTSFYGDRGPIGPLHGYDNGFRAVENGFQLFRCSSGGWVPMSAAPVISFVLESGLDSRGCNRECLNFTLLQVA